MPDPFERHGRKRNEWDSRPSRSAARTAAATVPEREPAKKAPGKKDPDLCKATHWKRPHQPGLRLRSDGQGRQCGWDIHWWKEKATWVCYHEEACSGCGKILRSRLPDEECPQFCPLTAGQQASIDSRIAARKEEAAQWLARRRRQPKPVISGPQGYRRKRSA